MLSNTFGTVWNLLLLLLLLFSQSSRGGKPSFVPEGDKHEVGRSYTALPWRSFLSENGFPRILLLFSSVFVSFQPLDGRKGFLEREDEDGLCCQRSPRLKTRELNVQLARELETTKIGSGKWDAKSLSGGDEGSMFMTCSAREQCKTKWQVRTFLQIFCSGKGP